MKMSDLKKGVVYAMPKTPYDIDIRRVDNFLQATYIGPAPARYHQWNPSKKSNSGAILVEIDGARRELESARRLLMAWDEMPEQAKDYVHAAQARLDYETALVELVAEIDPDARVSANDRSWDWEPAIRAATVQLDLRDGVKTTFDPADATVRMPAELFRRPLQGVQR